MCTTISLIELISCYCPARVLLPLPVNSRRSTPAARCRGPAHHDKHGCVLGGGGDDDLLGAALDVGGGLGHLGEHAWTKAGRGRQEGWVCGTFAGSGERLIIRSCAQLLVLCSSAAPLRAACHAAVPPSHAPVDSHTKSAPLAPHGISSGCRKEKVRSGGGAASASASRR